MPRALILVAACAIAAVSTVCSSPASPSAPGSMRVTGTVQHLNLEGGFWAIRGDDGITYDPMGGLSPAFQRDGLRVSVLVKTRSDLGGIHMVGPIVEILDIKSL